MKDVAKLAGVSSSTVSLVINNSPRVSAETRKNVLKAIDTLNYIPNGYAVSLRQRSRECFGVLVPDVSNPYYIEIIKGLKDKCNQEEIPLQILETLYDEKTEAKQIEFLKSIRTTGYVFIGTYKDSRMISELGSCNIVFVDKIDESGKIPSILIDNRQSLYEATAYLIKKGCRNIWYLSQTPFTEPLAERLQGYKDAMLNNNLNPEDKIILSVESCLNKLESGYNNIKCVLDKTVPDAVVTSSDLIALGAIRGIYERGLKVPDDISVIGFDNIDFAKYCIPSLTTINQPRYQMGEIAYSYLTQSTMIVNQISNKVILKSDFIIRDSVKK
ncbi:MAG: LacI family DNA-binding transcriptional regulator [Acetivibrionales bacterium]